MPDAAGSKTRKRRVKTRHSNSNVNYNKINIAGQFFGQQQPSANVAATPSCADDQEFQSWKLQHGKQYADATQEQQRCEIFVANRNYINNFNVDPTNTFSLSLNCFSDLATDEFAQQYLTATPAPGALSQAQSSGSLLGSPTYPSGFLDLRTSGALTPIKNQGQCGSCWAFSTISTLESGAFLQGKTPTLVSLSEQNLIDCCRSAYYDAGCNGGWMMTTYYCVNYLGGVLPSSGYPYAAVQNASATCPLGITGKYAQVKAPSLSYQQLNGVNAIMAALSNGSVSIAFDASGQAFQSYNSSLYSSTTCSYKTINHGMDIVGYNTATTQPYWIVRNSWGTSWGLQGYLYVPLGVNMCGIESYPAIPNFA